MIALLSTDWGLFGLFLLTWIMRAVHQTAARYAGSMWQLAENLTTVWPGVLLLALGLLGNRLWHPQAADLQLAGIVLGVLVGIVLIVRFLQRNP